MIYADYIESGGKRFFVLLPDGTKTEVFDEHGNPLKVTVPQRVLDAISFTVGYVLEDTGKYLSEKQMARLIEEVTQEVLK